MFHVEHKNYLTKFEFLKNAKKHCKITFLQKVVSDRVPRETIDINIGARKIKLSFNFLYNTQFVLTFFFRNYFMFHVEHISGN